MQVSVLVGPQAGKVVMAGTITAKEIINELRNGVITVNDEAQRSLGSGAGRGQSTKELIDGDRVHSASRMKELVKFYRRVMNNVENEQKFTEGFFGSVQLAIPETFTGARLHVVEAAEEARRNYGLGKFLDALRNTKAGTLEIDSGSSEGAIHIGDGQGRCVGFLSFERDVVGQINAQRKEIRKLEKAHQPTDARLTKLKELEEVLSRIRNFLATTTVPFVVYVRKVEADGRVVGLPVIAEQRLYIEGNALNSRAAQEEILKFEYNSPVIMLLREMRFEPEYCWMAPDNIEEEVKSIGGTSSKIFTLSALVQAFSRSIVFHTQPIKKSDKDTPLVERREAFVRAFWAKVSEVFGSYWLPPQYESISDRVSYLKDRRQEQNVAFQAIFLQALGRLGHRLGELSEWDVESPLLPRVEWLSPRAVNYLACDGSEPDGYNDVWKNAMMKPASDGRWVFNNVNDSVTKTYKALGAKLQVPVETSNEEDTEVMDLGAVEAE